MPSLVLDPQSRGAQRVTPGQTIADFKRAAAAVDPAAFHDVAVLPHRKDRILEALLAAYDAEPARRDELQALAARLTRFQNDVGARPITPEAPAAAGEPVGDYTDVAFLLSAVPPQAGAGVYAALRRHADWELEVLRTLLGG